MPNLVAYNSGSTVSNSLQFGTIVMDVNGDVSQGSLLWCPDFGICNQYLIVTDSYTNGKTNQLNARAMGFQTSGLTDSDLIVGINKLASSKFAGPFGTLSDAINWAIYEGYFITNQEYPSIVTNGCVLNLDSNFPPSYPLVFNSWYDLTGNDNTGLLNNGITYDSSLRGSLVLNGANQYVSFSATTGIPVGNSNYTISVWFNPSSLGEKGLVGWGNYGTTNAVNAFRLSSSGIVNYWWGNDLSVSYSFTVGDWYNAVVTFDGTTRSIWVNGTLISSDTPSGHNVPYSSNLTVGVTNNTEFFDGNMGEVQIFDRALSSTEINQNYNALLPRYNGTYTDPCNIAPLCTPTPTPTNLVPTVTPTNTSTQTPTPTNTETPTQTPTPTNTETPTQTQTPTNTETPTPTQTSTPTPTNTITPTNTGTPTQTQTPTNNLTSSGLIGYYDLYNDEIPDGFNSDYDACSGTTTIYGITLYWNGTFDDGTILYEDNKGLTLFRNTTFGYYYYSGNTFNLDGATVYNIESCVVVTPTSTQTMTPTVSPTQTMTPTVSPTQTLTPTTTQTPSPTGNASFHFVLLPIDTVCYNYGYVNNSGNSARLQYVDCYGTSISLTVPNGGSGVFCAQRGALISTPLDSITITESTSCGVYSPTATPTQTPTQTPSYFSEITSDPKISPSIACGSIFFNPDPTVGNNTTFCNSTTLTNPVFAQFSTGTYYISSGSYYVEVSITNGNETAIVTSSCSVCVTQTPTATATPTHTPTHTPTPLPNQGFTTSAFTSNAISQTTGQYQIIAEGGDINKKIQGYIFVSNNYGANFTGVRIPGYWRSVAVSDNGQYMLAVGNDGTNPYTYKSSDYGVNWVQIPFTSFPAPYNYVTNNIYGSSVAISNNGQYQVMGTDLSKFTYTGGGGGYNLFFCIYVSNDYGSTWSLSDYQDYGLSLFGLYSQVTISANGQIILATASAGILDPSAGEIYRSSNYGVSFAPVASTLSAGNGRDVKISRDGSHAIAAFGSSQGYTFLKYSQDSGTTWNNITNGSTPSRTWSSVAIYNDAVSGTTAYASTTISSNLVRIVNLNTTPVITEVSPTKNCRYRLSVSNSGQYIIVRDTVGIWRSSNYGLTFNYITS